MNAPRSSSFGAVLRRYREAASLSEERLAECAGLSLRGISDLERGVRSTPRLETVGMLADGLGLDADDRAILIAARTGGGDRHLAADRRRWHRLPVPATPLVGRTQEIEAIADVLRNEAVRLVTLTGPGGVGKTRIALAAAHRLVEEFADGVIFVDLSPVRRAELVLPAIATRLGIPEGGQRDLDNVLDVALQDRDALMVLDNLEQVVDAAGDIAALLATASSLRILATSRVILRLAAEHVMTVDPLHLPAEDGEATVSDLAKVDAVALFVARAQAVDSGFALTEANAHTVATLVSRLEGLPLAIELAAARVRILPPDALLDRLQHQLPVLIGGPRDAPERQRAMRDAIAWSHDLLTPVEREIFRWLSIFPGGCTLDAASAMIGMAGRLSGEEILEGVAALMVIQDAIRTQVRSGDVAGALQCFDLVADIAIAAGDAGRAAWCIGAVEGVLTRRGMHRDERVPEQHQARIDALVAHLGEKGYRAHWRRGYEMAPEEILAEARAWSQER